MRETHQPRRILLTGATGTVGRALMPALASTGAKLRVLLHHAPLHSDTVRVEEVRSGDVLRPDTLGGIAEDCDVVVHAAARNEFQRLDHEAGRRVNVDGTRAMLREAESAGTKTFVLIGYTGTIQERDDTVTVVDEDTPPETGYRSETVRAKYEAEAMVLEANRPGRMRTLVVSPGALLSPGLPTMLQGLVAAFLSRELPYRLLDGVCLAISDGADLGRCAASAIARGHGGRRYFATGECVLLGELYERLSTLSGVPPPRRKMPDLLVEELGLLTPVLPPRSYLRRLVIPRELVFHLQRLAPLTNQRTRTELEFTPTPLEDLLTAVVRHEGALARDAAGAVG